MASVWFMILWIMQRKTNPNTNFKDLAYVRGKRPQKQKTAKGIQDLNERGMERAVATKANTVAAKSKTGKDVSVT